MGISFLGALGYGGGGFIDGMNEYEKRQQAQMENEQRGRDLDAQTAYGNALTGAQGSWAQQPNSIWQRLAGLFGQAQEEQRNPMGATALPEGVQPVQQQPNMFDDVRGMARQELGMGPAPMPQAQGMPQGPMGAAQPMPQAQPQGMPQAMGQPMPGRMSLPDIAQRVAAANPGAPPHVLAGAIDRFRPWMNDEAKVQWQQAQMTLREADIERKRAAGEMENARKWEQGNEANRIREAAVQQRGDAQQKMNEYRQQMQHYKQANDQRNYDLAAQKFEQAQKQWEATFAQRDQHHQENLPIKQQRADTASEAQKDLAAFRRERLGQHDRRLGLEQQKLEAVQKRFESRQNERMTEADRRAAYREVEQAWKQYNENVGRMIQADAQMTGPQKAKILVELSKEREAALAKYQALKAPSASPYQRPNPQARAVGGEASGGGLSLTPEERMPPPRAIGEGAPSGPAPAPPAEKNPMRAEPQQAPAPQAGPPVSAFDGLAPGMARDFGPRGIWKLENGVPVKVQ